MWQRPLKELGWVLETGHTHDTDGTGPCSGGNGQNLALTMGDFQHEGRVWHTVALGGRTDDYPGGLIRWGWAQILGEDLYELADGGVCLANAFPDLDGGTPCVYVLFKIRGSGGEQQYVQRPRTAEGFTPGRVLSDGACVTAPGSSDRAGNVFGLYRRRDGGWLPTSLMISPSELPELPCSARDAIRRESPRTNGASDGWGGLEGVYVRRLFGRDGLVPAVPPPNGPEDAAYWRVGAHPTAQVITKPAPDGRTLWGFVDPLTADRFGLRTVTDHPEEWVTLRRLHEKVTAGESSPDGTVPDRSGDEGPDWRLCETVDDSVTFMFDKNMFPVGEVTAVVGPPKLGMKSWLGAELAACVATGRSLGALKNLSPKARRVLYLTNETAAGQKRRIEDQIFRLRDRVRAVNAGEAGRRVIVGTGRFQDRHGRAKHVKLGDGSIPELLIPWAVDNRIGLVVFDTLLTYLPGAAGRHSNYWEMGELVQDLVNLAGAINGPVVYMHHTPKNNGSQQLGSQALDGKVAQTLFMNRAAGSVPRVSATVLSRLFTPVETPISFRVDPLGDGRGFVNHMTNREDSSGGSARRRHRRMMRIVRAETSRCHAITRGMMVEAFRRGFKGGATLEGMDRGALKTTSTSFRRFVEVAKAEGWIAETGRQGNAKHYKLDTCPHVATLLADLD